MTEPMEWSKKVRFSDSVKVHYIPKGEDRCNWWFIDKYRARKKSLLNPTPNETTVSVNHVSKG